MNPGRYRKHSLGSGAGSDANAPMVIWPLRGQAILRDAQPQTVRLYGKAKQQSISGHITTPTRKLSTLALISTSSCR